jgi:hypothetical protein
VQTISITWLRAEQQQSGVDEIRVGFNRKDRFVLFGLRLADEHLQDAFAEDNLRLEQQFAVRAVEEDRLLRIEWDRRAVRRRGRSRLLRRCIVSSATNGHGSSEEREEGGESVQSHHGCVS